MIAILLAAVLAYPLKNCEAVLKVAEGRVFDNLDLGIPGPADQIVERRGYALGYSERYEQPLWVSYRLTADEVTNTVVARAGQRFLPDLAIATGSALPSDYTRSGYDRGHLAPAADFRFDRQTMLESFSMANMSPQLPAFNRGMWKRLEEHVRALAVQRGSLVVVTGPIFYTNTSVRVIGESRVRVPDAFYKAVYAETEPPGMVAFVLPHEGTQVAFCAFVTNVDAVEEMSGLDLFSALPDVIETNLEQRVDASLSGASAP